uniref:Uncharacterized protein n=1 Tax=Timema poppense TaxID=170557 RepID=A0A7R9CX81_TIMPO|nr:unnamed protein product [Timema poppensis]
MITEVKQTFHARHTTRHTNDEHPSENRVYGGWLSTVYLLYLSFFSMSEIVSPEYQYDAVKMSIYYALSPVAFSLALSWVILACVTGHGGWLNSALSWRGLTIFSKISYSVYLTQFLVFFYNVGTTKTSPEFNAVTVYVSLFEFILVLLASTIMTLLFDLPMQEVKNILMDTMENNSANFVPETIFWGSDVLFMLLQPNMTVSSECSHARMGNLGTHSDNFVPATRIWAKGTLLRLLQPIRSVSFMCSHARMGNLSTDSPNPAIDPCRHRTSGKLHPFHPWSDFHRREELAPPSMCGGLTRSPVWHKRHVLTPINHWSVKAIIKTMIILKSIVKSCIHKSRSLPRIPKSGHNTKSFKCSTIGMQDIRRFHQAFYDNSTKSEPKRTSRAKSANSAQKTSTNKYYIKTKQGPIQICAQAFLSILGISKYRVQNLYRKHLSTGASPEEKMGADGRNQKVPDQAAYYSRQLYMYNFTVCRGHSKSLQNQDSVTIYHWLENERYKGSNEITSALIDTFKTTDYSIDGIEYIRLCSDGYPGKNNNSTVIGNTNGQVRVRGEPHYKSDIGTDLPILKRGVTVGKMHFGEGWKDMANLNYFKIVIDSQYEDVQHIEVNQDEEYVEEIDALLI